MTDVLQNGTKAPSAASAQTDPPSYYFFIDGSNLMGCARLQSQRSSYPAIGKDGKPRLNSNGHPIQSLAYPNVAAVSELVRWLQGKGYAFKLFFDTTAEPTLHSWQGFGGKAKPKIEPGKDLLPIYRSLQELGNSAFSVPISGNQADDVLLSEANHLLKQGYEVFVVSNDKFNKQADGHRKKYPDLFAGADQHGNAPRLLRFDYSQICGQTPTVVFSRFPQTPPEWLRDHWQVDTQKELRLSVDEAAILAALASKAPSPPPRQQPAQSQGPKPPATPAVATVPTGSKAATRAPTVILSSEFSYEAPGLRLWGSEQVFSANAQRSVVERLLPISAMVISIGRADEADIMVKEGGDTAIISREHLRLSLDPTTGRYNACDAGSTNGTWLNTTRLLKNQPVALPEGGGHFCFARNGESGSAIFLYYDHQPTVPPSAQPAAPSGQHGRAATVVVDGAPPPMSTPAAALGSPQPVASHWLCAQAPGGVVQRFHIDRLPFVVGTEVLAGESGAQLLFPITSTVSRKHLVLTQRLDALTYRVENHGTNATELSGYRYEKGTSLVLSVNGPKAILAPSDRTEGSVSVWIEAS